MTKLDCISSLTAIGVAAALLGTTGCQQLPGSPGTQGAAIGGVGGAATGALIGGEHHRLLGALVGFLVGDLVGDGEPLGTAEPDGVGVTDGVGVGEGVTDGFGFGPFFSAAATAALYAASECPMDLPLTRTVGVPVTPSRLARSVMASTSGT